MAFTLSLIILAFLMSRSFKRCYIMQSDSDEEFVAGETYIGHGIIIGNAPPTRKSSRGKGKASTSKIAAMAALNSGVLACNYAITGTGSSDMNWKLVSMPSVSSPVISGPKLPVIRAQQARVSESNEGKWNEGRRTALLFLAATLFTTTASTSSANAGVIEEYLEKSKANKELNDKKRLATSGANFARAYTVEFGTCKFPENFTGCQDLAKQKKVPFISEDLELECKGKDKYKCGSNVFWKW
ncbi:hypothetical protein HHK36_030471 [Tetracentron sinense]|uniref:Photosystem I reaction center subunit N, chloroplastic n=1 Tax=Tetracentron sinense TaxID=13715 RepID=A0A835D1K8_TETSI|nr:hypothetical protein HHK36_030471 [Tetracentron sinense]